MAHRGRRLTLNFTVIEGLDKKEVLKELKGLADAVNVKSVSAIVRGLAIGELGLVKTREPDKVYRIQYEDQI